MKKILLSLIMLLTMATTANAQVLRGDANKDGNITIADVTQTVNTILGKGEPEEVTLEELLKEGKLRIRLTDGTTLMYPDDVASIGVQSIQYVDLGLPSGTLWAEENLGVTSNNKVGLYFAWGDVEEGDVANGEWSDYKWSEGSNEKCLSKYCTDSEYGYNGFTDGLTELETADDIAYVKWGKDWRIPSQEQFEELIDSRYTTLEWTGTGCKITSKINGYSIFFPAGHTTSEWSGLFGFVDMDSHGLYWTRTLDEEYPYTAASFFFYYNSSSELSRAVISSLRSYPKNIRPVRSRVMEYVDLGLPSGTKWATCNVGACGPTEYGDFFSWGEVQGLKNGREANYYWGNYKYADATAYAEGYDIELTKYCTLSDYGHDEFTDGLTQLQVSDDAASMVCGGEWCMPTKDQFEELFNSAYTTVEWTTVNGQTGRKVTSKKNGKSIFLPAHGYYIKNSHNGDGAEGGYWTSTVYPTNPDLAYAACLSEWDLYIDTNDRCYGQSIRPVLAPEHNYVDMGLPSGTKWADCNMGADSPEQVGLYYAWGDIEGYGGDTSDGHYFGWSTYRYNNGSSKNNLTKYCYDSSSGYNSFIDEIRELEFTDDAASVCWGRDWQMPSDEQFEELINSTYTTTQTATLNGVQGYKITSKKNGNSIFLPTSGMRNAGLIDGVGSYGLYWSRNVGKTSPIYARTLGMINGQVQVSENNRYMGQNIRPVRR